MNNLCESRINIETVWKMDKDGAIVGQTPQDKYNHGIKALIYGLVNQFGYGYVANRNKIMVKHW